MRLVAKCVVTVGILLTLLLAGGAPSGHTNSIVVDPLLIQVGQ
jgi:hypothetical protein